MRLRTYTNTSLELVRSPLFIQQPGPWWRWTASRFCTSTFSCSSGGFSFDPIALFRPSSTCEDGICDQNSNSCELNGNDCETLAGQVLADIVLCTLPSTSSRLRNAPQAKGFFFRLEWFFCDAAGFGLCPQLAYIRLVSVDQWGVTPILLDCCFSTLSPPAQIHNYALCILRRTSSSIWITTGSPLRFA